MGNTGSSPIYKAAAAGDYRELCIVVQQDRARINEAEDQLGWTPLHVAAYRGYDAIARELLNRGANPNMQDKEGRTPLMLCSQQSHQKVVEALMRAGADPTIKDRAGHTAMDAMDDLHPGIAHLLTQQSPVAGSGTNPFSATGASTPAPATPAAIAHYPASHYDQNWVDKLPRPPVASAGEQAHKYPLAAAGVPGIKIDVQIGGARPGPAKGPPAGTAFAAHADQGFSKTDTGGSRFPTIPSAIAGGHLAEKTQVGLTRLASASDRAREQLAQLGIGDALGRQAPAADAHYPTIGGATDGGLGKTQDSPSGKQYTYQELYRATNGFAESKKIGVGGYGAVYRGQLDGIPVAIKVMDQGPNAMQGVKEFRQEVSILSRLHHPHIVLLIGSNAEQGLLVYEMLEGGNLEDLLMQTGPQQQQQALFWQDRVRIAAEVAAALLFLHSAPDPIVHMDLKPSNILLMENRVSKLGDVGLARLVKSANPGQGAVSTVQDSRLVGTLSYMDPEYLRSGQFSTRSDIYALGMVMLQLLTGLDTASVLSTVEQARKDPLRFQAVLDRRAGPWPLVEAQAFADLALKCVEYRRQDRPDLRTVILPTLVQLKQRTQLYPRSSPSTGLGSSYPGVMADNQPPAMFVCPITQEVMEEPVFAADGYTYERMAIEEWIKRNPTSPLTNMPLAHTQLVPNHALRSAIKEWQEKQKIASAKYPSLG